MDLHRTAIGALCFALFGLMVMPSSTQAQQQGSRAQDSLTYEHLSTLLEEPTTQTYRFAQLDSENIRVVNVEGLVSNLDDTQRQQLREMYENVETEELHNAIENSPTIKDALRNEGGTQIDARDVIALDMRDGGQIVAYVDPNNSLRGLSAKDSQKQENEDRETRDLQQQNPQTFERLHSAMHQMETHTKALMQTDEQRIRVVNVGDVIAELDDKLIQRLRVTYHNVEADELHSALKNQESIKSALDTETGTYDPSDVVAVDVRDNGETIVYVDPNNELENDGTGKYEQG
jgi:hypothetical protein